MRTSRPVLLAAAVITLAAALSGCTASITATVSPDKIADLAEDALEAEIGARPEIDCGADDIELRQGTTVPCLLTDPATGSEFDADVTLSKVDGTDVTVSVQVADAPNGAPEDAPSPDPTIATGTLVLSATEIAATAEKALKDAGVLTNPGVVCPGGDHEVSNGFTLDCTAIDGGTQYAASVTISDVEGSSYSVNVIIPELVG
jgi:hypothetical protein